MDALELKADKREVTGRRVKHLRSDGLVPAVLYGQNLEAVSLQIDARDLTRVIREAGTHQLIALQVDQEPPRMTLARDLQQDVIRHDYIHVDFYAVQMDQKVTAEVPLILTGEAPAVMEHGGILTQGLDELVIECLPADLISSIEVNVEGLTEINDTITVTELQVPGSITVLSELESMVAKIEPPRKEEELEALLEEDEMEIPVEAEPEVLTEARDRPEEEEADEEE